MFVSVSLFTEVSQNEELFVCSTNEPDEAQRVMTLNKSLDIVLEGTRHMMEGFAARLKTPTYVLYSIFILIPLALVALLPAVSIVGCVSMPLP